MATSSLAEKLAALSNPEPQFGEIVEEEDDVTGAKVADEYEDTEFDHEERSSLRTANAMILDNDERYKGRKFSRKEHEKDRDFMEHSSAELGHMFDFGGDSEEASDDEHSGNGNSDGDEEEMLGSDEEDDKSAEDADSGDDSEEVEEDDDCGDMFPSEVPLSENDSIIKVGETDSTYSKGVAVVGQLGTWDKLLEQRILLQKMLTKVNQFPEDLPSFLNDDKEHNDLINEASKALSKLSKKSTLLRNCLERKGVNECEMFGSDIMDIDKNLEKNAKASEKSRREIICKWSDRTQKIGSMGIMNTSAVDQVDQIMSNMPRLLKRTRVKRVDCKILGKKVFTEESDPNVFDDSDFYHHLLRELIEKKTAASSESGDSGRQWLQIQKLRSKLKKTVDTRASKGRKVRYDIHTKLVNFMAPVHQTDQMADSAKSELFSSLFGARKIAAA